MLHQDIVGRDGQAALPGTDHTSVVWRPCRVVAASVEHPGMLGSSPCLMLYVLTPDGEIVRVHYSDVRLDVEVL